MSVQLATESTGASLMRSIAIQPDRAMIGLKQGNSAGVEVGIGKSFVGMSLKQRFIPAVPPASRSQPLTPTPKVA
jgi:hypothetical protein